MAKVLIVEDELIISMTNMHYLKTLGHEVIDPVISGKEAIELSKKFTPDIILLDIQLDDQINGYQVAQEILNEGHSPTFIFTSGNAQKDIQENTKNIPKSHVLIKPIDLEELKKITKNASPIS